MWRRARWAGGVPALRRGGAVAIVALSIGAAASARAGAAPADRGPARAACDVPERPPRLAGLRIDDRPVADLPRRIRDRALGRVLGRAVAHEVGHFLLASPAHTRTGLMRASHRIERLLGGADDRFAAVLPAMPTCLVARASRRDHRLSRLAHLAERAR